MDGDTSADTLRLTRPVARKPDTVTTLLSVLLVAMDVVALVAAFMLGYLVRAIQIDPLVQPPFIKYRATLVLHVGVIIAIFYLSQMYHQRRAISRIDHWRNVVGAITVGALMVFGIQELIFKGTVFEVDYPRSLFFYVWGFSLILVLLGREIHRALRTFLRRHDLERANLVIVGMGKIARDIMRKIQSSPELGYRIVGIVNVRPPHKNSVLGVPVLGDYHDLPNLIDVYRVEQVIIALPDAQRSELVDLISLCRRGRVDIKIYPDMFSYMARDLSVDDLGGTPLLTVRDIAMRGWKLSLKRLMDIVGAGIGLVILSPLMVLTALLIRLESHGSVFYTQERMGLDERPFQMIKFRSMREDAEAEGPGWTVENDPRVTRLGRFLRRSNWDEIPQLINVLIGEMSLVGPRPERPIYVQQFRDRIPRYMERHREKSGMTGWAQVNGLRGDTSIPERTSYDLWYVENWSIWLDLKIAIRTLLNIILRRDKNAY